ncbi:MAG: B12-binding domain-containing radical SAM protein [Candidatus Hydrogenedentes bacterium]|jgi:anaerobic magnesium-protoporphyrin IX monomethyl ester cyclase|nr:B12-binding domain-containing radical SAM protein [Candidatus Hydrogenedentota bacterium]
MHILFVLNIPYAIEPHGVMLLSSICKKAGHKVSLTLLKKEDLVERVKTLEPDVVAYSVIGSELDAFKPADEALRTYLETSGQSVFRIMGGPHPTFSPGILDEMKLDAICQGDGERALPTLLTRLEKGESLEGIPNIGLTGAGALLREKLNSEELDALPLADRDIYYEAVPYIPRTGLRSFMASRGCPYHCTFCYNHVYNRMFKECGPLLRRRSVDSLLSEIEDTIKRYPPVRFIRFFDDTFSLTVDDWLREFSEEYPKRIGIPFYCLMRPNTFSEEAAQLLKSAGCYSISMAVEAGSEPIRNGILKRGLSDADMRRAFEIARKYKIKTYGNTMIGIPGTTIEDDFNSLNFTRSLKLTVPTFSVCSPSRGTELADYAIEHGYMPADADFLTRFSALSPLTTYTMKEKKIQARIACLGTLYCTVPRFLLPFARALIKAPIPISLARKAGFSFAVFRIATRLFPHAIPKNPITIVQVAWDGIRYFW